MTKVFISWSGEKSKRVGGALRNWLPSALQAVEPYFTPDDIEKGSKWNTEISSELEKCDFGIICLTKENIYKPWILFESGALSKNLNSAKICALLVDIDPTDVQGPLAQFQHTKIEFQDFLKLFGTINKTLGERRLDETVLNGVFEMWWPKLIDGIGDLSEFVSVQDVAEVRSERSLIEEILTVSRNIHNKVAPALPTSSKSDQSWTDAKVSRLTSLWMEGETASVIGRELHMSRNAVIGKVHRLGLPSRTASSADRIQVGDRVFHQKFGDGDVLSVDSDMVTVDFQSGEIKIVGSYLDVMRDG